MRILPICIVVLLFGCRNAREDYLRYQDGRQLLTLNATDKAGEKIERPEVWIIAPDSIRAGEEFLAKLFLSETDEKITAGYTDCNFTESPSVDTTTLQIDGCKARLLVRKDTVLVAFKPQSAGIKTFQIVTLVTRDKRGIFRTIDYTFKYKVFSRIPSY